MDATRLGQVALIGWRQKLADRIAGPAAARLPVSSDHVRALVGGLFFALAVKYVVTTVRNAAREARR